MNDSTLVLSSWVRTLGGLLCVWLAPAVCHATVLAEDSTVPVGVARIDITPEYPIRLSGFGGRRAESEGIRQRIWARAMAIGGDAGEGPAILVTIDTLGVSDALLGETSRRLAASGVKAERVALTATHTHSAPMIRKLAPTLFGEPIPAEHQAHIEGYTKELQDKLVEVSRAALSDRQPARLEYVVGEVTFARNRRTANGPVDHDLMVLRVKSPAGDLRAVYVSYACHCVTLSDNQISGDWAGYAAEHLERQSPGCVAMISVGCGADSNPSSGVTGSNADAASAQGLEIAREVKRLQEQPGVVITESPTAMASQIELPLAALPTREEWEARAKMQNAIGYHARVQLARLERGESLVSKIDYPIRTWQFGDKLAMVFLPGEVVVDYSLRLKRELDHQRVWINAYANGSPGYVPSERVLKEGGYEGGGAMVYYDIPGPYAAGLEDKIVQAVRQPLEPKFRSTIDSKRTRGSLPRSPQQAIATLKTLPDHSVELVASEPLLASPVAIDFGPDGKLWVAEMYDYPNGIQGDYQPAGRVRVLEDSDGDGKFDRSEVFLSGIPFPTGITVWRNGVLVCAAPDILYAEDTNGDRRADVVKKLFSGFGTENYQARVNSLRYGLDGWVYGSCGLFGGQIVNFRGESFALGNRDFRIQPDTGALEPVTGTTQQGRVRNDWGDWFGCDNGTLVRHYPLDDRYARRSPSVAIPATASFHFLDADPSRLFSISNPTLFPLSGPPNRVTAACGLEIYRDERLGEAWRGDSFTCEPVSNLVHHLRLQSDGTTFAGKRAAGEETREFLASTDTWFRPVQVRSGPDGAVWIVDMYRYVIEHPRWIPPETVAELDVRAGHDRGRIYRVAPRDGRHGWPSADDGKFAQRDANGLVTAIDSPNGWQRDMAQQLLLWRQEKNAAPGLRRLLRESSRPETRLHALATLDLLQMLMADDLIRALADDHAGVRRHAIRIAEVRIDSMPQVAAAMVARVDDQDPQVQLQFAYTIGQWRDPRAAALIAKLLMRHHADPNLRWALLTSIAADNLKAVTDAFAKEKPDAIARQAVMPALIRLAASTGSEDSLAQFVDPIAQADEKDLFRFSALRELLLASAKRKVSLEQSASSAQRAALERTLQDARTLAADAAGDVEARATAIRLLGLSSRSREQDIAALKPLLSPQSPVAIQTVAVEAFAQMDHPQAIETLLSGWSSQTPRVRSQVIDVLLQRPRDIGVLLSKIRDGAIAASEIDAARRTRLINIPDERLRQQAQTLLADAPGKDRQAVIDRWQDAVKRDSDVSRGKAVFAKSCAPCHQLDGVGYPVGQNLAALTNRSPQALLIAILDPSRQVDERFVAYVVTTNDGRTFSGILVNESSASITLRGQEGKEMTIVRGDIEELRSTGKSLMPEGLERDLKPQDLADLLSYLGNASPPPKPLAGNHPAVVQPDEQEMLALSATQAEIFGGEITFEAPFQNVGFWHAEQDHVDWQIQAPQSMKVDVWLDYACNSDSAGNAYVLEGLDAAVRGTVVATGGWDQYRLKKVGTASVLAGQRRIVLRPDGPIKRGALFDLRAVVLAPTGKAPNWETVATAQVVPPLSVDPRSTSPEDYAARILDEKLAESQRVSMVQSQPHLAAELIAAMAKDLKYGDATALREEYRRIPWIWRVAISAGKRNETEPLRKILKVSLPAKGQPLRDWQAVVMGGGLINGISQSGPWPAARIAEILGDDQELRTGWQAALDLAAVMVDDPKVSNGTRYDALRMLGVEPWSKRGVQLTKYLGREMNAELQMGAVSALADMPEREAAAALRAGLADYAEANRGLAIDGLLRNPERTALLIDALATNAITLKELDESRRNRIREAVNRLLEDR